MRLTPCPAGRTRCAPSSWRRWSHTQTGLRVDALGNLIAWKKGRKHTGSKLLLTAHMDEVGLMIRQITDDGYLKFDTVGAIDRRVLLASQCW